MGQMAGVAWGTPTEGGWQNQMIPLANVPTWQPAWINAAFNQDDVYVEIPFVDTLKNHGVGATWTDYGNAFRDTTFDLWCANYTGRNNLRNDIAAPNSGHPLNNPYWYKSIDWQIESNYAGAIAPGLPSAAAALAWRAGHVMNWGEGVYGGVAFAAMQARAYTATDFTQIIEAGRDVLPVGSGYRQMIQDMMDWYEADADKSTFEDTWQLAQNKYGAGASWIEARANGAWVMLGLMYGREDIEKGMQIAMRGGDDSDCNPSSVGAIVGTYLGLSNVPLKFKQQLNRAAVFSYTGYSFEGLIDTTGDLARSVVRDRGGTISDATWSIPESSAVPVSLEIWSGAGNDVPSITAQVAPGGNTRTFAFSASATDSNGVADYVWYFGDTWYSHGAQGTHTFLSDGTFEAVVYVSDVTGNTGWRAVSVTVVTLVGDVNLDGAVNALDIAPFVDKLTSREYQSEADVNKDGAVNALDISGFVSCLTGGTCGGGAGSRSVPEPSSMALGALLCGALLQRRHGAGYFCRLPRSTSSFIMLGKSQLRPW